jgi:hypothetical protein
MKWSPDPSQLTTGSLQRYAELCGHVLARAHARSGDAISIAGYVGTGDVFADAVAAFSASYSDQVATDYAEFQSATKDGRLVGSGGLVEKAGWAEFLAHVVDQPPAYSAPEAH